jgi:5'(3')-deoxyribonucleotidase
VKLLLENWRKFLKENEEQTYQIYCDMDGVLVDFVAGVVDYINEKLQSGTAEELAAEIGRDYITREDIDGNTNKAARAYMYEELENHADFWRDLPWMEGGKELWDFIVPYNPHILTTPMGYGSEIGKQEWIDKNLNPPPPHKVFMSQDKYRWAVTNGKPNILIDDFKKNTIPWEEKGGIAILHTDTSETIYKLEELLNETTK